MRGSSPPGRAARRCGRRPALRLSLEEREAISRGLAERKTLTAIAKELGRSVSTVSREVRRNSGPNGYRGARADRLAMTRIARPRPGKLAEHRVLRGYVEDTLTQCWSPRQISRRLVVDHPDDPTMRVSPETIYTALFVQTKALLRTDLTANLRSRRVRRRPQRRVNPNLDANRHAGRIKDITPVSARPVEALDRREPGHWEADLLVGRHGRSHLVTLVERLSRYLLVLPVKDATSRTVITAVAQAFRGLTDTMRKTLTWDRGTELTRHAEFTSATGIPVYLCDAYCPWQRGSNGNHQRPTAPVLPDEDRPVPAHEAQVLKVVAELNSRPREVLNWQTPFVVFSATSVAMIA